MKRFFTLVALALVSGSLMGQFTMNRSDFPMIGDEQYYTVADTTGLSEGPSGTGQTWDFSGATSSGSNVTDRYIDPMTHPNSGDYPNATLTSNPSNGAWRFFIDDNDSIQLNGEFSLLSTPVIYSDNATLVRFPFNFTDVVTDSLTGQYSDGILTNVTRWGQYITEFDGDGTLITPFATYNNVNRVKTTVLIRDSSWTGAANSDLQIIRYEWYEQGRRMPVMRFNTQAVALNGGSPTVERNIWYADSQLVSIDPALLQSTLQVYPNPAEQLTQVSYSLDAAATVSVKLMDIMGKEVATLMEGEQVAGEHKLQVPTADLPRGLYFIRLEADKSVATRKLMLH